jgi:hypothetical protein
MQAWTFGHQEAHFTVSRTSSSSGGIAKHNNVASCRRDASRILRAAMRLPSTAIAFVALLSWARVVKMAEGLGLDAGGLTRSVSNSSELLASIQTFGVLKDVGCCWQRRPCVGFCPYQLPLFASNHLQDILIECAANISLVGAAFAGNPALPYASGTLTLRAGGEPTYLDTGFRYYPFPSYVEVVAPRWNAQHMNHITTLFLLL